MEMLKFERNWPWCDDLLLRVSHEPSNIIVESMNGSSSFKVYVLSYHLNSFNILWGRSPAFFCCRAATVGTSKAPRLESVPESKALPNPPNAFRSELLMEPILSEYAHPFPFPLYGKTLGTQYQAPVQQEGVCNSICYAWATLSCFKG